MKIFFSPAVLDEIRRAGKSVTLAKRPTFAAADAGKARATIAALRRLEAAEAELIRRRRQAARLGSLQVRVEHRIDVLRNIIDRSSKAIDRYRLYSK